MIVECGVDMKLGIKFKTGNLNKRVDSNFAVRHSFNQAKYLSCVFL